MATNLNPEIWKKVGVDVQSALATALTITAITKASPAQATSTGHGLTDGAYVLLLVQGMSQLNFAVARVAGSDTNTFQLEGIDSTLFDDFVSGTAQAITFGNSASTFTDVSPSGGEAEQVPVRTIHSDQDYNLPGNLSALNYAFGSLWQPDDVALAALRNYYLSGGYCAVRFRFQSGRKLVFTGYPSASLAPAGAAGAAVTTPVSLSVRGRLQYYAT